MPSERELLRHLFERFNARDIDAALATMHPSVVWANGLDGGYVYGHAAVRSYWTRQWETMDSATGPHRRLERTEAHCRRPHMGRPNLAVEVMSPRLRIGTLEERLAWFAEYGVRECWLVRPVIRQIEVFLVCGRHDEPASRRCARANRIHRAAITDAHAGSHAQSRMVIGAPRPAIQFALLLRSRTPGSSVFITCIQSHERAPHRAVLRSHHDDVTPGDDGHPRADRSSGGKAGDHR